MKLTKKAAKKDRRARLKMNDTELPDWGACGFDTASNDPAQLGARQQVAGVREKSRKPNTHAGHGRSIVPRGIYSPRIASCGG